MRKLSILLFVLVMSIASFGQAKPLDSSTVSMLSSYDKTITLSSYTAIRNNQFEIHSVIKVAIVEVRYNGDLYILPSIVCDCDKCKSYNGLKFIRNIYKNEK